MKTITKKLILCFLVLSTLISCVGLVSCQTKGGNETEENTADKLPNSNGNDDSELTVDPGKSYGGEDFTVLTYDALVDEFGNSNSEDPDAVEEALFNRDSYVEEELDVQFVYNKMNGHYHQRDTFFKTVDDSVSLGHGAWDLIGCYSMIAPNLALHGRLFDLQSLNNIDFTRAWYPQFMLDACTINDKTYFITGDISTNTLYQMYGVAFNPTQANARGIKESKLYEMVYNNEWTYEALFEMCETLGSELHGNGTWDQNDFYPIVSTSSACIDVFYFSSGLTIINEDDEGHLSISGDVNDEKVMLIYGLVYDAKNTFHSYYAFEEDSTAILDNRCIFSISPVVKFRNDWADADQQYRILPLPKFESGDATEYQTLLSFPHTQYCVPVDSVDKERSTVVMEYLGYASYNYVTPEVFEETMKLRYSANEDCSKMFDIMRNGCTLDIASLFYMAFTGYPDAHSMFRSAVLGNVTNWQSNYTNRYDAGLNYVVGALNDFYGA